MQRVAVQIGAEALVAEALRFLQVRCLSTHREGRKQMPRPTPPGMRNIEGS